LTRNDIDCEEALRKLFDFIDQELDGDERDAMQRHLATCRGCFSRANFEQRLKEKVHELRPDDPAPAASERIRRLLQSF
jgi:anti-sigma factor (TIGR02949 family)